MDDATGGAPLRVDMQAGKPPARVPRLPAGRQRAALILCAAAVYGLVAWLSARTATALQIGFHLVLGVAILTFAVRMRHDEDDWRVGRVPVWLMFAGLGAALLALAGVEIRAVLP
jgi:hypothetical protein